MPAYVLRQGQGKAIVIYSRCEEEELCRAELLAMPDDVNGRVPKRLAGGPVHGYYDVDPTYTRSEFLKPYRNDPARRKKLMDARKTIASGGWNFPVLG